MGVFVLPICQHENNGDETYVNHHVDGQEVNTDRAHTSQNQHVDICLESEANQTRLQIQPNSLLQHLRVAKWNPHFVLRADDMLMEDLQRAAELLGQGAGQKILQSAQRDSLDVLRLLFLLLFFGRWLSKRHRSGTSSASTPSSLIF